MVGVERFELSTSCSQSKRATGLRYTPIIWSAQEGSNLRPEPQMDSALPTELCAQFFETTLPGVANSMWIFCFLEPLWANAGARQWVRTTDLLDVNQTLYR